MTIDPLAALLHGYFEAADGGCPHDEGYGILEAKCRDAAAWVNRNAPYSATPPAIDPERLPPGTRLILAAEDTLVTWGTRTERGERITVEWGERRPEGWYEPAFTAHYDDRLGAIDPERLARALRFLGIDWPKRVRGWSEDDWRWAARQAIAAYEAEKEVLG